MVETAQAVILDTATAQMVETDIQEQTAGEEETALMARKERMRQTTR